MVFLVRKKSNGAHQNSAHPMDLEIRCNLMIRITRTLKRKYLKDAMVRYIWP